MRGQNGEVAAGASSPASMSSAALLSGCAKKPCAEWEQLAPGARGRGVSMTTTSGDPGGVGLGACARVRFAVRLPVSPALLVAVP